MWNKTRKGRTSVNLNTPTPTRGARSRDIILNATAPTGGEPERHTSTQARVLERLDIDQEDIEEVTEKAKKGLGMLGRLARRGLEKGAELASQGIEAAKDTIEERRASSEAQPAPAYAPAPVPAPAGGNKFCPNCGQSASGLGKFCNHCGQKLE